MKHRIKEEMKPRFDENLTSIGINDIHYKSSLIIDDYIAKSSTADHIYSLTSMLDASSFCSKQFVVACNMLLSQTNIYNYRKDGMLHRIEIQTNHLQSRELLDEEEEYKNMARVMVHKVNYSTNTALLGYLIKEGKKTSKNFPYLLFGSFISYFCMSLSLLWSSLFL